MEEFRLDTPRMYLRKFAEEDAAYFYLLNNDPLVIQHTGDQAFADPGAAAAFILTYNHYERYGYGRWAVVLKETQRFIGFCGLKYHPETQEVDLGFRIGRSWWNQGLGTEAASACLKYGFTDLGLERIIGRVRQANRASVRVLKKLGMQRVASFDFEGFPGYRYELMAKDWL